MAAEPLFMVQETPNVGTSLLFPPQPQQYPWGTYPTHFSNLVTYLPSQQGNGVNDIKINTTAEYPTFIPREKDHPMDAACSPLSLYLNTFAPHIFAVVNSFNPPPWVPRGTLVAERVCRRPPPPSTTHRLGQSLGKQLFSNTKFMSPGGHAA